MHTYIRMYVKLRKYTTYVEEIHFSEDDLKGKVFLDEELPELFIKISHPFGRVNERQDPLEPTQPKRSEGARGRPLRETRTSLQER